MHRVRRIDLEDLRSNVFGGSKSFDLAFDKPVFLEDSMVNINMQSPISSGILNY